MAGRALRHGRACAATWSGVRFDMVGRALRHGQVRPVTRCRVRRLDQGWVRCALDSVLIQCTAFSHCLGHCSQDFSK